MNEIQLRFSDVAYAAGTTPKQLRNWLQREQVQLISEKPAEGWRAFSLNDVAILALVRSLIPFVRDPRDANTLAHGLLKGRIYQTATWYHNQGIFLWWVEDEGCWSWTEFDAAHDFDRLLQLSDTGVVLRPAAILDAAFKRAKERGSAEAAEGGS